jgi:hypothetical protein
MKAISLDRMTAFGVVAGTVGAITMRRSVPREMIGRKVVVHAKTFDGGSFRYRLPAVGVGYATFGEARPRLDGDCDWPVTSFEPWATLIPAPGRTGFFIWHWAHG